MSIGADGCCNMQKKISQYILSLYFFFLFLFKATTKGRPKNKLGTRILIWIEDDEIRRSVPLKKKFDESSSRYGSPKFDTFVVGSLLKKKFHFFPSTFFSPFSQLYLSASRELHIMNCECGYVFQEAAPSIYNISKHELSKTHRKRNYPSVLNHFSRSVRPCQAASSSLVIPVDISSDNDHDTRPCQAMSSSPGITIETSSDNDHDTMFDRYIDDVEEKEDSSSTTTLVWCEGWKDQTWKKPFAANYPWSRHDREDLDGVSKWIATSSGAFISKKCTNTAQPDGSPCVECLDLKYNTQLTKYRALASDTGNGRGHTHPTRTLLQLRESLLIEIKKNQIARIDKFALRKSLSRSQKALGMYRRVLMTIASNDVPRIHLLLAVALKSGYGVGGITKMIAAAITGKYHAKGFTAREKEEQLLVWRLGGARLVYAMSKATGASSLSTVRRLKNMPRFQSTHGGKFNVSIVESNIHSMTTSFDFGIQPLFIMMSDEVAVEPSPSIDMKTNQVTGICCEHGDQINLLVNDPNVPTLVRKAVDDGTVHIAKECLITSIAPLGGHAAIAIPIFATATCKTGGYEVQIDQIEGCMRAFKIMSPSCLNDGKLVAFGTDGDPARRQANVHVFLSKPLSSSSPLFKHLRDLKGLDLRVGP